MKSRLWLAGVAACLAVGVTPGIAANYYINDGSLVGDIYTSAIGHDANPGTTNSPKTTLSNVVATCNLQPGDVVYIDTGTYPSGTIISNSVQGTAVNPIRFQGSTNGVVLSGAGVNLSVLGRYLDFSDIRVANGTEGVKLTGARFCNFTRVWAVSNSLNSIYVSGDSNNFRRCVAVGAASAIRTLAANARGNYVENSILLASGTALWLDQAAFSNMVECVIGTNAAFLSSGTIPNAGSRNIFWGLSSFGTDVGNLSDLTRLKAGWVGNTYADPLFVNYAGLDFHVLSPAGYVSNGVWVINAAVGYSPTIDFGLVGDPDYALEPEPNGARVNSGLFSGDAEASKSRTNAWLFAMSFNDGGMLNQTGQLEWVGGNLGAATTVDLQMSTNAGLSWSNIATTVAATNESYTWVPTMDQQAPSALWRVLVSTNPAVASTNARAFGVRVATNAAFTYYVNNDSTLGNIYCSAIGNNANDGVSPASPKQSLQAILDAYVLTGGDTVLVDTGDYTTNFTTVITRYDSGAPGRPVRIVGSPAGTVFGRGSTSLNTLEINTGYHLELDTLRLSSGNAGLALIGASNIVCRKVQFTENRYGVFLSSSATRNDFEGCLAASNTLTAFYGISATSNNWSNGTMWGSPTSIVAQTNSVTVSNSILGGGTVLFGSQAVYGDYNLVWQTQVGLTYSTFSALQNASFGWGRSLFADPLFANAAGGDYHVQSLMGRYNPATGLFETNDVVHSPSIDLGGTPLTFSATNEPEPNGSRLNVGMYGGTDQASKSRTNEWLQVLSYVDGGTLDAASGSWLRWTGGNFAPGSTVTLWLSRDAGDSWETIVTNVAATNGAYFYINTSTNDSSALYARWQVSLEGSTPPVASQTPTNFTYRNGPFEFFVNDGSTSNDVYCTVRGTNTNLGVTEASPMASLAALLDRYQLGPGDRVFVDTGSYYYPNEPVIFTSQDSGMSTNPVLILGSTNFLAGGSVFGQSGGTGMNLGFDFRSGASNILVRDIVLTNVTRGVAISNSANITLDHVEVRGGRGRAFDVQVGAQNIQLIRCVAHGGGTGVALQQATNVTIRQSIFWQNKTNAVYMGTQVGLLMENNLLASTNAGAILYSFASLGGFSSDYNGLYTGPNTRVGENRTLGSRADNVAAWNTLSSGRDVRSVPGNPQLADPEQFDYHLKTAQPLGRRLPNGQQTSDSVSSPLLDAGNPATDATAEPAPNGGRVNIGRFGGTAEASSALATPWLEALSYGDAGIVQNGVVTLRWLAGGGFSNETAKVEVSVDGGKTWGTTVTSGVPATNGLAQWTVTGLPDTPAGVWRVVCLQNTNITAQSRSFFSIRNNPLNIYVGTSITNDAIYTTGPGLPDNWMATFNAPLNSLRTVFDRFDLEPGDQIWMDVGNYAESQPILVGLKNSGTTSQPVQVTGNPAAPYNGVILSRSSRTVGATVLQLAHAGGVQLRSLAVSNGFIGIHQENSQLLSMDRVRVVYCVTNSIYAGDGSRMEMTGSIVDDSLYAGLHVQTGATVKVQGSLFRGHGKTAFYLRGGDLEIKNSVLEASGSQRFIYFWGGGTRLVSDFNNIRAIDGASVGGGNGRLPDRFLIDWQISTSFSNDVSSFGYDAEFANENTLDFHLKSEYGRYDPVLADFVTNDTVTSKLIDLGDPSSSYVNEPTSTCGRIDVGLYGNSAEASKSSGVGALVPLTMSDGGTVRNTVKLYWSWNCIPANEIVNVDFSDDGGLTWTNIATNIFVDTGTAGLSWNTTNFPSTAQGVWRVSMTNGSVGITPIPFAVKNDPLKYYVNDGSTNGDVYSSAIGRSTNSGLRVDTPIDSVERLLGKYKVEPGDTVYVDTGIYPRNSALVLSVPSVETTNRLIIQGSTNEAAGGTVFTNASGAVVELQNTRFVELRDLRLHGGDKGLLLTESSSNLMIRVRSVGAREHGFELGIKSDVNQFIQCAALNFSRTGFHVVKSTSISTPATTNQWIGGVIASIPAGTNGMPVSTGALMGVLGGRVYVSNSVFVASTLGHAVYSAVAGSIQGDYNAYHLPDTNSLMANVAIQNSIFGVSVMSLGNLDSWAGWNSSDSHSFSANPLFADLAAGDLHPKSAQGRYSPVAGEFVQDDETSPLIDAADPVMAWNLEPAPHHGRRANLGIYGNTPQASQTPTNGTFSLLTLNQGGVVRGTYTLKWQARGGATNDGHLVNIQLSTNSGTSWQTLAAVWGSQGEYAWNSTTAPSLPTARWRVQSQSQSAWVTASERDFVIHNTNAMFYVNDASTANDLYCTAVGSAENTGLSPQSPLSSLSAVLSRYDVEPGDSILLDTGTYVLDSPASVGYLDSGTAAEPVIIRGSTNYPGTTFLGAGIQFENARGVTLKEVKLKDQTANRNVVLVSASEDISLERLDILGGRWNGVDVTSASNVFVRNFSVAGAATNGVSSRASYNTRLEFGVLWSNGVAQVLSRNQFPGGSVPERNASYVTVSNCALGAFGTRKAIYEVRGNLFANYNNLYLSGGALAALSYASTFGLELDSVGSWSASTGQDSLSLSHDPRFVSTAEGDFHLKSSRGRFDPATGFVETDPASENSPLIDAGDPSIACTEPSPNGGRVNIGRYGNTEQASKTPTNGTLTLISFHDGGLASGTNVLVTWLARGATTNAGVTVTIRYSADGGVTWTNLATNIAASAGSWVWDSTLSAQSVQAKLEIVGSDGSSTELGDRVFAVRNAPFFFYINDGSLANDVYCSAVGNNTNSGLTASAPMLDLNTLLAKYDLAGGDIVYIDTGRYLGLNPWHITQADSAGSLGLPPVVFQGSTNSMLNGTVLDRAGNNVGIQVDYAVGVQLRNIFVSNTTENAVVFNDCYGSSLEWMAIGVADVAVRMTAGSELRMANSLVYGANQAVVVEDWNDDTNAIFPVIEHCVFWKTMDTAIQVGGQTEATVRNCILSPSTNQYVYDVSSQGELIADYNDIWLEDGARVFLQPDIITDTRRPVIYESVGSWSAASGQDLHSYDWDPLLVDPANFNFHLKSRAGRWVQGAGGWTNDPVSSPLIDAGSPSSTAWTNEPGPNGSRVNVGLYGGTPWASKSSTNSALYLLTLNHGGIASGQLELNWSASGLATGHTVRLEVSIDDGDTWILVASAVPATLGGVTWNSQSQPSTPLALWRVLDEQETNVFAVSDLNFVLHNGPVHYYVNDEFMDGDIYCTTNGDSGNTGATPGSPKRWVSEILETYNLEPGDVIYVDTGIYQTPDTTVIGDLDSGDISQDPSQQVTIQGSTNEEEGGSTYILSDSSKTAFEVDNTFGIRFKNLNILGARNGIVVTNSYFVAGEWLTARNCEDGIRVQSSSNVVFTHSAMVGNQRAGIWFSANRNGAMHAGSCLMWSNRYGLYLEQGFANVSNTLLGLVAPDSFGYYIRGDSPQTELRGDYNNLYIQHSRAAAGAFQFGEASSARTSIYVSVSAWSVATGQDSHSMEQDPLLADPDNGDYHPKSPGGRYEVGTGWVVDTIASPLIDAGSPQSRDWLLETDPNGRRINIGLYGGSAQASRTPSSGLLTQNFPGPGARVSGDVRIKWSAIGAATNYTVHLEYSGDDGNTWTNIVNGWPGSTGEYLWDSVPYGRSALAWWRITALEDVSLTSAIGPFVLNNGGTIAYYVNDASTNGDVFCTAVGDNANNGLTPATPKASLQAILDTYELAPEDLVSVDAGTYVAGSPPVKIDQTDSGWSNLYVTIRGSTNPLAPTIFQAPSFSTRNVFSLEYAVNVRLKDLTIQNATMGLEAYKAIGCEFDGVTIKNNQEAGLYLAQSDNMRLIRSILWKNTSQDTGGVAVVLANSSILIENSVLWGSPKAVTVASSALTVTNSVLYARGTGGRIYDFGASALASDKFRGDYNNYTHRNGSLIAEQARPIGGSDFYNDLPSWSALVSSDRHSMTADPDFADEINGDFHPRSTRGRYYFGVWTNDVATNSPLIDAGSLAWPLTNEPAPNGGIVNIGAYGNTAQASMSQTNPPRLRVISYDGEGTMSGNALLYWLHGGMASNELVRLDYSTDYEVSWRPVASNVPAGTRQYQWDVTAIPLSLCLQWRVVLQSNTNIYDVSECNKNKPGPLDFYVNDTNIAFDVWCTGPGLPWDPMASYGTNAATPLDSLATLLAHYPVGGGDRVFIDTGVYPVTDGSRNVLDVSNTGTEIAPLKIYGSTNKLYGGTLFRGNGTANGIDIQNTRNIELYDLRFEQVRNGVSLENVDAVSLNRLDSFNNLTNGIALSSSSGVEVKQCLLWKNKGYGFASIGHKGAQSIEGSTIWGNSLGAVRNNQGVLSVSNSLLVVTNAAPIFDEPGIGTFIGNYNQFGLATNAVLGNNQRERVIYSNLRHWQQPDMSRDANSLVLDPLFVNPAATNFHLQSRGGYLSNSTWAVSTNTSWAIDAGNPASPAYTNETSPNGGRLNLGAYGGTREASRSDTNLPALLCTTLRDGGVAPDGQPLHWMYRGIHPTNTIRIEYSRDNGQTWLLINSAISVGSSPYTWFSTNPPTPVALWRIILESDPTVRDTTTVPFTHLTSPLIYYVNDDSQVGDMYTTAPGSITNNGYSPDSPLPSIQDVLARYQMSKGGEIKVDTGVYTITAPVELTSKNNGDTTNRVKYTGSTNLETAGSWFQPAPGTNFPAFLLFGAKNVDVSNFRLTGFLNGVSFQESSEQCTVSNLDIQSSSVGVEVSKSSDILLKRVLIRDSQTNGILAEGSRFTLDSCVLWSNQASAIGLGAGAYAWVTNSVLAVSGSGRYCYEALTTGVTVQADYNILFITNGAQIAVLEGLQYVKIPQWVRGNAQCDLHSLGVKPWFHDPVNGDFHLRSVAGRYQSGIGWVQDVSDTNTPPAPNYSRLIDMGAPSSAWSNEPSPNGGTVNIGLYGNTWQDSKSNTNQWLKVITANNGGIVYGGFWLNWGYGGGIPSNAIVQLEYSFDNGRSSWVKIGNTTVGEGKYWWQSDLKQAGNERWATSPKARWRIFLLGNTNVMNITDDPFGLRNKPFEYFLNDTSTVNDVYCSAIGSNTNDGFYAASPLLTLPYLLETIDLEPTDKVYVDTGVYWMNESNHPWTDTNSESIWTSNTNTPIVWEASDGGEAGQPVVVLGSTHTNGSRFVATMPFTAGYVFRMDAGNVDMRDLKFSGENMLFLGGGLVISNLSLTNGSITLRSDDSLFTGFQVDRGSVLLSGRDSRLDSMRHRWGETTIVGTNVTLYNSVVYTSNNLRTGVVANVSAAAVISNCTIVSSRGTAVSKRGSGTLKIGHSILVAGGSDVNHVIAWNDGGLISDWNDLLARDSAWIGNRNGKWEKLAYWQEASGQDAHSVSFEPLFQNELQGDFHLNSTVGRWSPVFNSWDVDGVHSPVIDLGDPWIGTRNEPMPHGNIRNLGAYGGTVQASKSLSTLWLTALTQNDGGVLKGPDVVLRWAAGNANDKTVNLQYYDGTSWLDIATGVVATNGSYVWDSTGFPDAFYARWRVVAEDGSGISDQTDGTFALRNQAHAFYVNDENQTDDIYCSAIGSAANDGLTEATPKLTLQSILDTYDLEGGDVVYLDTGTYASGSDIRIIWSRSGDTNADVVIQGNTNGAYTVLTRSGSTNFPAAGLDVKASRIQLNHLAIQGVDRSILLESNVNASVNGSVVSLASTGISVDGAQNTQIRNSAFWQTGVGVRLNNTRTSVLENLTFAISSLAGIQLVGTETDTLQNNIFMPAAGAHAYFIGASTSLLTRATMDYNLYDFGQPDSGFFAGYTNTLRKWQLESSKDFRSAITNADLVDFDFAGDFHPRSEYGRWTPSGWVQDETTSWAVDHGNPISAYDQEPPDNGSRINVGMYGNTVQASMGSTNLYYDIRTMNEPGLIVPQDDQVWPFIWYTHLVDTNEWVSVQFSGDCGLTWATLTNVPAYTEYYIWQARVEFQTAAGRWRVIGVNDTNVWAQSDECFTVRYRPLGTTRIYPISGLMRVDWQGGVQGKRYHIEYSDDFGVTWNLWPEKYNGPAPINKSNFVIPVGESQLTYTFEDRTAYLRRTRWYRIWELPE